MKKNLFASLILIFCFGSTKMYAQTAFYDAKKLKDKTPIGKKFFKDTKTMILPDIDVVHEILKNYVPDTVTSKDGLIDHFKSNPFMQFDTTTTSHGQLGKNISTAVSSIGGLDVTNIADGLGKFLAKRTKEELNVAFFERFNNFLFAHPEIKQLFPSTTAFLNSVYQYQAANMLSMLRAAFESDLKAILGNLAAVADLQGSSCDNCKNDKQKKKCKERLETIKTFFNTDYGRTVMAALVIADGAVCKKNPADILSLLAGNKTLGKMTEGSKIDNSIINSLKLLNVFSTSLRSNQAGKIWVSPDDLKSFVDEPITFQIFLGLVYQQIKMEKITTIGTIDILNAFEPLSKIDFEGAKTYIKDLGANFKNLADSYNELKKIKKADSSDQLASLTSDFISGLRATLQHGLQYDKISSELPAPGTKVQNVFNCVDSTLQIAQMILEKNYHGAVLSAVILVEQVFQTKEDFHFKGSIKSSASVDTVLAKKDFMSNLVHYGNFMSDIVSAKNSDEAADAIEAMALPPGSASIKRTKNFNICVQAYTGFSATNENLNSKNVFNGMSVYAPVGIAFNFGLKDWRNPYDRRTKGSASIFFSIIDVGAIVSYRFRDPDTKLSDSVKIRFENIFAPGVNFVYGIPKVPLSIGTGFQWQPSLQRLTTEAATITENSGWRWHIFLAMDLPLINISSSKK